MSVDDVLLLVMLDNTAIGKQVFDLLSECRTVFSDGMCGPIDVLIDRIDDVLGPVGDTRSGGFRELLKVEQ